MCGIIHVKRTDGKSAGKAVWKRYKAQETRGSDGFGYIAINDDNTISVKRFVEEDSTKKSLLLETASNIIFHHRWPTSTENFEELNHPIYVSNDELKNDWYVIHNGVITNDDVLFDRHKELGYVYTTLCEIYKTYKVKGFEYEDKESQCFNDSECLAIELARYFEGLSRDIGTLGNVAFIALQVDKKTGEAVATYTGRNAGNPLELESRKNLVAVRSQHGKVSITENVITRHDLEHGSVETEDVRVGNLYYQPSSTTQTGFRTGGYNYSREDVEDDDGWNTEIEGLDVWLERNADRGPANVLKLEAEIGKTQGLDELLPDTDEKLTASWAKGKMEDLESKIMNIEYEWEDLEQQIMDYPQYKYAYEEDVNKLEREYEKIMTQIEALHTETGVMPSYVWG